MSTLNNKLFTCQFVLCFGRRTHAGVAGEKQCAYPFEGKGKVLAHAYFASDGRIHFDDEERYTETGKTSGWWLSKKESQSLLYVAVHEIGHALGPGALDGQRLGHVAHSKERQAYPAPR